MRITITALLIMLVAYSSSQAQIVDNDFKARVWFRGDLRSLTGPAWTDVSGNKTDATALAGEEPAATGFLNYNSVMVFDGVDDYLKIPYSVEGLSGFTMAVVFQSADTTERGVWGDERGVSRKSMQTTRRVLGPEDAIDSYGRQEQRAVVKSTVQTWDKAASMSTDAFLALGSTGKLRSNKPFKGTVAEFIIFDRPLDFLQRVQIETYLAIKYGVALDHNYVSSGLKVLWRGEGDKAYATKIAGIGRDDAFQLYQKQSVSAEDSSRFLILSAGTLATRNTENKAIIQNQDFLVWGDNNLSLLPKPGAGADSVLSVVQRKWQLRATGNTVGQLPTELRIDINQLPPSNEGYWLVIDRSGANNFSVDNLEYIMADRITTDGKVVYKVLWDTDRSGSDVFSFAKAKKLLAVVRKLKDPSCADKTAGKVEVEMIAGKASYSYVLTNSNKTIKREWRANGNKSEQKDLTESDYTLSVRDANKEEQVRHFSLTQPDALHFNLGEDLKLISGNEIVLDISNQIPASIPVTYKWTSSHGFSSAQPKITVTESGIYQITVIKQTDGCEFSDEIAISGSESQRIAVYPTTIHNGQYNVSVSLPEAGGISVRVYTPGGILMREINDTNRSEYHYTGTLKESGLYLVVIQTPYGVETRKIISY